MQALPSSPRWPIIVSLILSSLFLSLAFTLRPTSATSANDGRVSNGIGSPGELSPNEPKQKAPEAAGLLTISEFRLRGPAGARDEFVELYNDSNSPLTVSSSDGSSGYSVAASDGVVRFVIPNGTVIPARGHFLGVNSTSYSLSNYPAGNGTTAIGDATYTTDILDNAGIALFTTSNPANFTLGRRLDAVGTTSESNTLYKEGAGYPALTPFSIDYSWYRDLRGGTPKDTDNNAADFLFVDTNGTSAGGGQRLGAPGPENLNSPTLTASGISAALFDSGAAQNAVPNEVHDPTSDPPNNATFGTITYRRKITNTSGQPITRLRFKIINLTTFPSPSGVSDLRPRTCSDSTVSLSGGGSALVLGTTLEQPPSQPNGGGFNSTLSVNSVNALSPIAPGASVNVQFLLGSQQNGVEVFETDLVSPAPGTLIVSNVNDSGAGSLRQAIIDANTNPGTDTISFAIPGSGVHTISPITALPTVTDALIINGPTQPGYSGTPLIELNGISAGSNVSGLTVTGGSSTIRGLAINRFTANGIVLQTGGGNKVEACFIGTNPAGTSALANTLSGVLIQGSANNVIGGITATAGTTPGNLISGNGISGLQGGIAINGNGSTNNTIQGNVIGLDVTGSTALANNYGILVGITAGSPTGTAIGGAISGARNVISGNTRNGLELDVGSNQILGNFIGTDITGHVGRGNGGAGISNSFGSSVIGGGTALARNVISANGDDGISVFHQGCTIRGNYIGTDVDGNTDLGNHSFGIDLNVSDGNVIGGTSPGEGNLISGNDLGGFLIANSSNNSIQGNLIGTKADGASPLGNAFYGAMRVEGGSDNTVGGTTNGAGNIIAFNTAVNSGYGAIYLRFGAVRTAILGNSIHDNDNRAIDLTGDGVTANDACDVDTGPNNLQNFPIMTAANSIGGVTSISGTLNSTASTQFRIEFFSNPTCDGPGNGEGQVFLGSTNVTTDGSCNALISANLSATVAAGQMITATATDSSNNTSEFSPCQVVTNSGFSITGRILDISGNAMPGVGLSLTGGSSGNTTTDGSGNFTFANLTPGGNYTVTPSAVGASFSPANQIFNNLNVNRIANFAGTQTLVSINGLVTDANNAGLASVTINLLKNGIPSASVQTDGLGNYRFGNLEAGANYVVTPAGSFSPSNLTFGNLTQSVIGNFKAVPGIPTQCNTVSFNKIDSGVGVEPRSIGIGDFNRDGKPDLAVVNIGSSNVSILLSTGPGTFSAASNIALESGPEAVAIADFNGDANLDLAIPNANTSHVSVLLGTGTGTFGAPATFTVGAAPYAVAIGDFNLDGKADLAVANQNSSQVSILLGNGNGTFGAATNFSVPASPYSVAVADFNQDGKSDLAVVSGGTNSVAILLGTGGGNFGSPTSFTVGTFPQSVVIADFNLDAKADLAVANKDSNNVSILLGNGTGGFAAAANVPAGTAPFNLSLGDLNSDGKTDLAVADLGASTASVLLGTGLGTFAAATSVNITTGSEAVAVGDFNFDNKNDLIASNAAASSVSALFNNGSTCNASSGLSISGQLVDSRNLPLADVVLTLSGPITRVTQTDQAGNYSFGNLIPGGNFTVTLQSNYFVFAPSRADFFNLSSSQLANFVAAPLTVPLPTPTPSDDFGNAARDANKWTIGAQTSATTAFDPQVTTTQVNGQLVVTPRTQASGMHYAGYVSANSFDLRNGTARVEVVQAGTGGADTIFALGTDADNFYRFMVHTPGPATTLALHAHGRDGIERPLDTTTSQLVFQVSINGQLTSLSINYDPVQHRFMRFRHVPAQNSIVFETSPDNIDFTIQHTVVLQKNVSALTAELSAGTSNPGNPGSTVFDNFGLVTSTFQFSATGYSVGEGDGSFLVTVTRTGSLTDPATVDFNTADETARQKTKYTSAAGTLAFTAGLGSRTFRVLLEDNQLTEGEQRLSLLLSNPTGAGLNSPGRAMLTISDNDTTLATGNPMDDARYFTTQHYYDFLSRLPDQSGLDFWTGQITQCGTDAQCLRTQRITVSNAFFYEQEYQQTGSYVVRLYRAAFGNNQPISNNDNNPNFPNENKKLVNYSVFSTDRARVRGGPSLAQTQLDLANAFVLRSQFLVRYPSTLAGPAYVDALLAGINTDIGVDLSSQRTALIDLFNSGGRGAVLYRLADDNTTTNPINNRAFIDAEYNRSFVLTQYFGYLRRNPDIGGYIFWLGQVNSAPLRALEKQRAMVCSFITSTEYQQRFSPVATHNNTECQ